MEDGSSPIYNQTGRAPLARDNQQWILDYLIQQTGKAYHFQGDGRGDLPSSVKSHAMISKHLAQDARRLEDLARREESAGHDQTALALFYKAANGYLKAQHPIFALNDEKRFLYRRVRSCYDKVIELAPYRIEKIDIPWNGTHVSGILHLDPNALGPAPLLFLIPGCDSFKEAYPNPQYNFAHQRGMHVFSFDGPGMAESNLRGIKLTADNFEDAAVAALDHLVNRPEIDPDRVVLYANSFGSFWGLRFAARDRRIKAIAATQASICEKYIQTDLESPRWKQLFAFITQAKDEHELDAVVRAMTMDGYMEKISCPTVLTVGEFDPRAPLDEMFHLFDQMTAPAELWVMADQHHLLSLGNKGGPSWGKMSQLMVVDWLSDRLQGKPLPQGGNVLYVQGGAGPYAPGAQTKRRWFEGLD